MGNNRALGNYSIEMYIGEKRSGKTLSMVAETYETIKTRKNVIVYANFTLNKRYFPTFKYITKNDLENFYRNKEHMKNAIFLIDEGHIFFDARAFMQRGNMKISYFFGQMGKRGNVLKTTTHYPELVDYRARQYCERAIYIQKGLLLNNKYWKPIINNNKILTPVENDILVIKGTPIIRKMLNYEFYNIHDDIIWVKASKYFNMYDTEELIYVEEKEKN